VRAICRSQHARRVAAALMKEDDAENTLRRYESLTHLSCMWFKSVCGGYLA